MKKFLFLLMLLNITFIAVLKAENNDEWGAWFKETVKAEKDFNLEPEDKPWIMKRWRKHLDDIYKTFDYYIEKKAEGIDITKGREINIIPKYYFDGKNTKEEIDKAIEFYSYALKKVKAWHFKLSIFRYIVNIAYHGNEKAKEYINKQMNNKSLAISLRLRFRAATLFWDRSKDKISYLLNIIKEAQNVETTDLKFSSPKESAILSALRSTNLIMRLYKKGIDYDFILPIYKQMIFSRSKGIQMSAVEDYYMLTNRAEMYKIYKELWAKVHDKNTPRKEFLDALYGLQALYFLQQSFEGIGGKYKIGFKGIWGYFNSFAVLEYKPEINKKRFILVATDKEKRLSDKEKVYFTDRLKKH